MLTDFRLPCSCSCPIFLHARWHRCQIFVLKNYVFAQIYWLWVTGNWSSVRRNAGKLALRTIVVCCSVSMLTIHAIRRQTFESGKKEDETIKMGGGALHTTKPTIGQWMRSQTLHKNVLFYYNLTFVQFCPYTYISIFSGDCWWTGTHKLAFSPF